MRLERVYLNGEVLYREIPEENEADSTNEEKRNSPSFAERARTKAGAVIASARTITKRLEDGAHALGTRIYEGAHALLPHIKKTEGDEWETTIRLLPHLDAEGRHRVYLGLREDKRRLDKVQLGALLPYLCKEDFDSLCSVYREEKE